MPGSNPRQVVIVDGPPCHVEVITVRSALQQGVQLLSVEDLLNLRSLGVSFYTVSDVPLPATVGLIEEGVCATCSARTIRSRPGTAPGAQLDTFRRHGFDAA